MGYKFLSRRKTKIWSDPTHQCQVLQVFINLNSAETDGEAPRGLKRLAEDIIFSMYPSSGQELTEGAVEEIKVT